MGGILLRLHIWNEWMCYEITKKYNEDYSEVIETITVRTIPEMSRKQQQVQSVHKLAQRGWNSPFFSFIIKVFKTREKCQNH